jgi:catechol 2,3-dioxygenase-like lactoylglutathione lyase family enzyme
MEEKTVITGLYNVTVPVLDQESAKRFYTEKLGFELRTDATLDGFRWLAVGVPGQADVNVVLVEPQPPMFDDETAGQLRAMIAKGAVGPGVFRTDDCRGDYERMKADGVEFLQEPTERPYGLEALFRDDSGNWYSLTQQGGGS